MAQESPLVSPEGQRMHVWLYHSARFSRASSSPVLEDTCLKDPRACWGLPPVFIPGSRRGDADGIGAAARTQPYKGGAARFCLRYQLSICLLVCGKWEIPCYCSLFEPHGISNQTTPQAPPGGAVAPGHAGCASLLLSTAKIGFPHISTYRRFGRSDHLGR
jgi:hypothetical protein